MLRGTVDIEAMEFYAFHGCYEQEKVVGNRFLVDLSYDVDMQAASQSDSVTDCVSYLDVYATINEQMMIKSDVLESVASRILCAIKEQYPQILSARVKVSKCAPPLGGFIKKVSITQSF